VKRAGRAVELRPARRGATRRTRRSVSIAPTKAGRGTECARLELSVCDACRVRDRYQKWTETQWLVAHPTKLSSGSERARAQTPARRERQKFSHQPQEHQTNIARDFLGTFCRQCSVLLPKFPVLFPLPVWRHDAKFRYLFEKSGAGEGNRTLDIQLGKLSFYH
jgi:hypothetical protein